MDPSTAAAGATYTVLDQQDGTGSDFWLQIINNQWQFCMQSGSSPADCTTPAGTAVAGTWAFVAAVWDAGQSELRLYAGTPNGGDISDPISYAQHVSQTVTTAGPLHIGSGWSGGALAHQFLGQIADPFAIGTGTGSATGVMNVYQLQELQSGVTPGNL